MPVAFEDVPVDWSPLLEWLVSPTGLVTVLVVLLVLLGAVTVAGLLIYRAVRRRLPRGGRLLDRAVTTWRSQSLPAGPRRDLAELRTRLEGSVRETDRQLQDAELAGAPVGMLPGMAGRLRSGAERLDGHLQRLEREPNQAQVGKELPAARQQVEDVCSAAASMREAARGAVMELSSTQLQDLLDHAELEVTAVSSGTEHLREHTERPERPPE